MADTNESGWISCDSSNIERFKHDGETLTIKFRSGGEHQYAGISVEEYQDFVAADSKGKHFHQFIRNRGKES